MTEPRTRASNKRSASTMSAEQPAESAVNSEGSSSKSRRKTAVTSLDDEKANAIVEHRYGTANSDMTIVLADCPEHCFRVHQIVMALNSDALSDLISQCTDGSSVVTIPAQSGSSWQALDYILSVIYDEKKHIELRPVNRFLRVGDVITVDASSEDCNGHHVNAVVATVHGCKHGDDVRVVSDLPFGKHAVDDTDPQGQDRGDDGITFAFTYDTAKDLDTSVHIGSKPAAIKPRSPLRHLNDVTTIEHVLPLLSWFTSPSLCRHIEEHLLCTAYYAAADKYKRLQYARLANQFNCYHAFNTMIGFFDVAEVKQLLREHHNAEGAVTGLQKPSLEALVQRLAEVKHTVSTIDE